MRILVRVPEAYLLVRTHDASRPGLLVLDADGRRVESIALPGMGAPAIDAAAIAERLTAAQSADAVELWRFKIVGDEKAATKLRKQVTATHPVRFDAVTGPGAILRVPPGALSPQKLVADAKELSLSIAWQEPVPVHFTPAGNPSAEQFKESLSAVAGVWHLEAADARAYVTSVFLDPARLPAAWGSDIQSRTYLLPGIPKGGAGCRVALAPTATPGVVAIFADIFNEREVVVGRKSEVNWEAVERAFAAAGCPAKEKK